jgi:hypothetical protein
MYLRAFRYADEVEVVFSVSQIWKIEVHYAVKVGSVYQKVRLSEGDTNPDAVRVYNVYVGSDVLHIPGDKQNECMKVLEDIYKKALKA